MCGRDGRKPFPPEIEANILEELSRRRRWPCFRDAADPVIRNLGSKGMRELAFHQRKGITPNNLQTAFTKIFNDLGEQVLDEELIEERSSTRHDSCPKKSTIKEEQQHDLFDNEFDVGLPFDSVARKICEESDLWELTSDFETDPSFRLYDDFEIHSFGCLNDTKHHLKPILLS